MTPAIIHLPLIEGYSQAVGPFCLAINVVTVDRSIPRKTCVHCIAAFCLEEEGQVEFGFAEITETPTVNPGGRYAGVYPV